MNLSFSVSSCNKSLLQKGFSCLNLVRIWYIFSTRTFVSNAVKGPGIFSGGGGGCALIKAFCTVSQWVNASQIAFNTSILTFPQRILHAK